ncbi:hypothetical protein KA405_00145 [Patescibacteria group bacterium]|nr:hypothetical protein [Patescibacteria group bacterium]
MPHSTSKEVICALLHNPGNIFLSICGLFNWNFIFNGAITGTQSLTHIDVSFVSTKGITN